MTLRHFQQVNSLPIKEARRKGHLGRPLQVGGRMGSVELGISGDSFICMAEECGGERVGEGPANDVEEMNRMRGALHAQLRKLSPNCQPQETAPTVFLCHCAHAFIIGFGTLGLYYEYFDES